MHELYCLRVKEKNISKIVKNKEKILNKIYNEYFEVSDRYKENELIKEIFNNKSFEIYSKKYNDSNKIYLICDDLTNNPNVINLNDYEILKSELNNANSANLAKTKYLSNLSHDIRTPMNAIIGFTNLAYNYIDDKNKVLDYLNKISLSSDLLLNLINNVLEISKIEKDKINVINSKISIAMLIKEIKTLFSNQLNEKNIKFSIITENIINEDIYTDIMKLRQIFVNLISNSIKYTLDGGNIDFIIIQKDHDKEICNFQFIIRDNGVGMSKDFIQKAFEPYERDTNTSNIQGTGLGLSIVHSFIKSLGGTIIVNSILNVGSEFIIEFDFKVDMDKNMLLQLKDFGGLNILLLSNELYNKNLYYLLDELSINIEKYSSENLALYKLMNNGKNYYDFCLIDSEFMKLYKNIDYKIKEINGEDFPIVLIGEVSNNKNIDLVIDNPVLLSDFKDLFFMNELKIISKKEESINLSSNRILIVDDNELNREITKEILKLNAYLIDEAVNGKEAYEKVLNNPIDYYSLVLMDVQMPIMDGIEAMKLIRDIVDSRKDIPIIALTANAFDEEKERYLNSGMNAYLSKPIDVNKLISLIKEFIK